MKKSVTPEYESNPFVLAYQATKRLFDTNRGWAILLLILGIFSTFSQFNNTAEQQNTVTTTATVAQPDAAISIALIVFIFSLVLLCIIFLMVIASYITGIISYVTLENEKGNKVTLRQAFEATQARFWRLLGALLLALLKIAGWSLLLIIPGITAAIRYSLLGYVIMDEPSENKSVNDSHERSKQLVKGRMWEVFGISFTGIVPIFGTLFNTAGAAALYRQLQAYTDKNIEKPKIHWLNYCMGVLTLLCIALAIVFIVGYAYGY